MIREVDSRLQFISVTDIFDIFKALVSIRKDISKSRYIFPTKATKTSRSQKKKNFFSYYNSLKRSTFDMRDDSIFPPRNEAWCLRFSVLMLS